MNEPMTIHLSHQDIGLAKAVAQKRANAGEVRWEDAPSNLTPQQAEEMGMLGEIAAARHYGIEPYTKIERNRADGGADLTVGKYTADVKTTTVPPKPHKPEQPHLLVQHKEVPYDVYISAYLADPDQGIVQLLGYATRRLVLRYPYKPFWLSRKVRAVPNDALCPIRRREEPPYPDPAEARLVRHDLTNWSDYQRCLRLLKAIDVPNGVWVPKLGKRGTLINAQISVPGFPPGVRVVLEGEEEIVRNSYTKKNPAGTPISRDFYSADVKVVER